MKKVKAARKWDMSDFEDEEELSPSILNNSVTMSNVAARGAHNLTKPQKRIVTAAISFLDSAKSKDAYLHLESRTFRITAKDYAEMADLKEPKDAYAELQRGSRGLMKRELVHPKKNVIERINWIEKSTYHPGEGWVEVALTPSILPYLVELKTHFTQYQLEQIAGLRSIYSWRLFEYLTSWSDSEENKGDSGEKEVELDNFRLLMEIPDSYKWHDIKRKVIIPAVADLEARDGWEIQWEGVKRGRRFELIKFAWQKATQADLFRGNTQKRSPSRQSRKIKKAAPVEEAPTSPEIKDGNRSSAAAEAFTKARKGLK